MTKPFLDLSACWTRICSVDVVSIAAWVNGQDSGWSDSSTPAKPQRIYFTSLDVVAPIVEKVLGCFPIPTVPHQCTLNRVNPGQTHPLHVDTQRADWLTRVHVPVVTNLDAWMYFEDEGEHAHFDVGWAYTFNTLRRHAFGNNGDTPRIHLLFDVLRKDT